MILCAESPRIETENLDALMEQGDFDGDGIIDDYEMVKDIEDAKSRVNILRKIEGLLYEAIFDSAKTMYRVVRN